MKQMFVVMNDCRPGVGGVEEYEAIKAGKERNGNKDRYVSHTSSHPVVVEC